MDKIHIRHFDCTCLHTQITTQIKTLNHLRIPLTMCSSNDANPDSVSLTRTSTTERISAQSRPHLFIEQPFFSCHYLPIKFKLTTILNS